MSKKVLILKNTGATLYQTPDAKRPSALELGRTLFGGKGTGKLNRLAAAAGLAGKGAALGGTAVQTAHQMQGGNLFAPLSAGYTYEGLDPSGKFLAGRVEAGKQGAEKFQSQQNQIPQSTPTERMGGYTTGSNSNQVGVRAKGPARFNVPKPGDSKPAKPEWMKTSNSTSPNVGGQTGAPPVNTAVPPGMSPETVGGAYKARLEQPQAPTNISNPFDGLPSQLNQPLQNFLHGTNTGQGPVNPQNNTAMLNAGKNLGRQIASAPQAPMQQQQPMTPQVMGDAMNQHMQQPQGMAAQPAQPAKSPMDLAMEQLKTNAQMPRAQMPNYQQQATTPTSTANALSPSNMNNANSVLDSYYNTLPQGQQAHGGAVQGAIASQGNFATDPQTWGQTPDLNQGLGQHQTTWSQSMPKDMWKAMLKAYVKQLYDEFGGYLYKMTPHEAGQFAVYTLFTLRK